ncbi:MAG: V-type ATP synthase subunit E [Christensenellales bacterium]|jgi:V/A-type H+-transporting ATPase subunit E
MTGLEKIVSTIREEARGRAAEIIEESKTEAADIVAREKANSDAVCAGIKEEAHRQAADIERAGISAAELKRRSELLAAKQQLITQTMERALQKLYALPEAEYFSMLISLAAANAERGQGEMLLNESDLRRCPDNFSQLLNKALPEGAFILVLDKTRNIDGGFILKYGDIELNCSFKAMIDARKDELTDRIRDILFS